MIANVDQMPAALAPYVVTLSPYDLGSNSIGVHRGLPSSTITITIPEQDQLEISWVGRPGSPQRLRAGVAGLHLDAAALRQEGCGRGVWLTLRPLGISTLFGVPASTLAGDVADLADVVPTMADLPDRLAACRSWPQRRAVVERVLLESLARHGERANRDGLRATLAVLSATTRVQEAAQLLGFSRRHLSSTVRAALGVTPKEYQRLIRFEATRGRLVAAARTEQLSLAAVAASSGFADQAHFTREWRDMAGCTPTDWMRAEGLVR
ncbi:helix-turn-helix domain-containing protein [Virgisporangium aurantiacum]|uniref:AraC family transcriptional regulator n=1 Tax=Virgisporangium aurantiacum TaxID=175570 RepID=A0A8J3Z0V4_9ACTN|nr:helix-turn-helix domain-containing protein [Virgisporangium aurantiacum]GIJ54262.1 AraC family transcriptional regulator [Virgisporangium aurantiacum]